MKKLLLLLTVTISAFTVNAQKVREVVTLKGGEKIVIYSDKTWEYQIVTDVDDNGKRENTNTEVNTFKSSVPNSTNSGSSTSSKSSSTKTRNTKSKSSSYKSSYSSTCGARTKSGGACRRVVSGGGRCWQH